MEINTSNARPEQSPTSYVWHGTGDRVTWPTLLRLWGSEVASKQAGEAGIFICDQLLGLADLAESWRVDGPAEMAARQRAEAEQEACYLTALERDANWDPGEPEDDPCDPGATGSLLGHPADEAGPMQAWLGDPSSDDTYMN
ncbi:MAG TPA: hypothetical protein VKP69_05370 [Isosphaeraceae bacterium]|nr:hypothetical protein [Isosphaeraceae bacterium]